MKFAPKELDQCQAKKKKKRCLGFIQIPTTTIKKKQNKNQKNWRGANYCEIKDGVWGFFLFVCFGGLGGRRSWLLVFLNALSSFSIFVGFPSKLLDSMISCSI